MKATRIQWVEFQSSFIWQDMKDAIEHEVELLQIDLENEKAELEEIRIIQGKLSAMRHFLAFPEYAVETLREIEDADVEQNNLREEE